MRGAAMTEATRVLMVEDLATDAEINEREVRRVLPTSEFLCVETRAGFLATLGSFQPDVILCDYRLPAFDGMTALTLALEHAPEIPFIVVTGSLNEATAVDCLKAGAWDYVIKESIKRLGPAVLNGLEQRRLRAENRRAEEALRALSARHEAILAAVPEIVMEVDCDKVYTWANRAGTEFFGQEVIGQEAAYFFEGEQETYGTVQPCFTGDERVIYVESWQRRKDGEKRLLAWWCRTLTDTTGQVTGALATARDITESTRMAEALSASRQILEDVLNAIPVRVFWKDRNLVYLGCNAAFASDAGFADPQDVIGKDDYQMGWRDQAERYRGDDRLVIESGCAKLLNEEPQTTPEGHTITLLTSKVPLRQPGGEINGVLGTYMDITERKQAEDDLAWSYQAQTAVASLLHLALEDTPFEELLTRALDLLLAIPWLALEAKGAIFLVEGDPAVLVLRAQRGLPEAAQRACALVPFGHCLCGRAAASRELQYAGDLDERREIVCRGSARHALYSVPILLGTSTLGVVNLHLHGSRGRNRREEALLTTVASALAGMIRHRRAEEALQVRTTALEASATAIVITDRDGSIVWTNPAFGRLTGYAPEETIGRNTNFLNSGRQDRQFYAELWQTVTSGRVWHGELVNRRRDGSLFTEEMTITPVRGEGGAITHFIAVKQDVSARRQAEEEKGRQLRLLQTLIDTIPSPVFHKDTHGVYQGCNAAWLALVGLSRDQVVGKTAFDIAPADVARRYHEADAALLLSPGVQQYEYQVQHASGGMRDVMFSKATFTDERGEVAGIVGVMLDVTEQRRTEQQLRQSQKMEAVGRLAGGMAHDFNNILQALLSQAQALQLGATTPAMVEAFQEIEADIRRGASLTQQLLLFSRRQVTQRKLLDLGEVVGGGAAMLRRLIPENIRLVVEVAPRRLWVDGDAGQLQQAVVNLALNARDAMPSGGALTIRAHASDGGAVVEVEDTGHGMDEATRDHLFEPFFTTKEAGHGTGLGLAVVHGIVEQHGGRVEVESQPGEGSRFRVMLPLAPAPPVPPGSVPHDLAGLPRGTGERILLVEDEEGARKGLTKILAVLGYQATAVASGEEALALAAAPGFDLLLSDLMLPGIGGDELAERLGARWPALKVVLMSGYTEDMAMRRGVEQRAVRFLQKPFDMATLAREMRAALGNAE